MLDHSVARLELRTPVRAAAVVLAVVLTALAAQFTVPLPFTAVPFTLTPLVVMLTGAALGSRLGFLDAGAVPRSPARPGCRCSRRRRCCRRVPLV